MFSSSCPQEESWSKPRWEVPDLKDGRHALHVIRCLRTAGPCTVSALIIAYGRQAIPLPAIQEQKSDFSAYNTPSQSQVASACWRIKIQTVHHGQGALRGLVPSPNRPWTSQALSCHRSCLPGSLYSQIVSCPAPSHLTGLGS